MIEPIGTYISDKYTYENYLDLHFQVNSPKDVWEKAINIFVDRIATRYFLAIDKLMERTDRYEMRKYGFAIVTLQCSLLDTLSKFRYGRKKLKNYERFESFLQEYFIFGPNAKDLAEKVYEDIRCGLVHEGATAHKSGISCECPELITVLPNGAISLDLVVLQKELKKYFYEYIQDLRKGDEIELRKNFVYEMNIVCKA